MRIRVAYDTTYAYERPARQLIQVLRMQPGETRGQRVPRWRVQVEADGRLRRGDDALGNITHTFFLDRPAERVTVSVAGEAVTTETAGVVEGAPEPLPPLAFLRETALTHADAPIRDLAAAVWARETGGDLARMHALMGEVNARVRFDVGQTDARTTAAQALELGHGVCQDLAHVMIAAARHMGLPARYVSGHLVRTDRVDQEAGHAWMEAHVADLGWVGFDPANAVCPTPSYLRVATALDYLGAAPVRGSRAGGGDETMEVKLRVEEAGRSGR